MKPLEIFFIALIAISLTNCATAPKIVAVPTPVKCPAPKAIPAPNYYILVDSDKQHPDVVVKKLVANVKMCQVYSEVLNKQLEGYR